ncbi:putative signal transducing protein [Salinarimonas chemoclinalis]|uniref:putative signal transducing protein n=1 Tax=Salinarimonas chemoclinalis TaxID=3241599 RepID=UPI0035583EE5
MIELMRTNDVVTLGYAESLLRGAGYNIFVADGHTSVMEGSIGIIQRRILVVDDEADGARRFLREAGLGAELRDGP